MPGAAGRDAGLQDRGRIKKLLEQICSTSSITAWCRAGAAANGCCMMDEPLLSSMTVKPLALPAAARLSG